MAGTAGALVRLLGLLWLWRCALALATPGASHLNAHSLSFNITVTPKMQLWCKAEVQVDREPCFTYDCQSKQVMPVCVQGKKVEDSLMKELGKILEDLTGEFKKKFLDSEAKDVRGSSEPPSLQAMMVIQEEASGLSRGSWQFVINGRVSLHFNMVDRTWTVGDPGDAWMLQKWEDKYLNKFLSMMSNGDCKTWFNNVIANWAVPATTALPSPTPCSVPGTGGSTGILPEFIIVIAFVCLACLIICFIII
ncbi:PREDICTED: NKG2D ligand 1-like isoform X2 [Condylura cristata]|uniref:NKG2D ligand 1-like isoform X2 n=1 Tax=Condylura cristata TaxID=143302 RepID=UPI000643ABCE|nr:PREDICTED: NKG2D ligand 1-like isoform X2 [Condylura cristata]